MRIRQVSFAKQLVCAMRRAEQFACCVWVRRDPDILPAVYESDLAASSDDLRWCRAVLNTRASRGHALAMR